jgi:hypothetical protein
VPFSAIAGSAIKPGNRGSGTALILLILLPVVLVIVAGTECGAIVVARRNTTPRS